MRGKLSVTWTEFGARHHTGLFEEVGGALHVPNGMPHAKGSGKVFIKLLSWKAASQLPERSLVRLVESVNRGPYGALEIHRLVGIGEAARRVGEIQRGSLEGTFHLGGESQQVSIPVRLIQVSGGRYLVEPIRPFALSARRMGIEDDIAGLAAGEGKVADQLKLFFTFELARR